MIFGHAIVNTGASGNMPTIGSSAYPELSPREEPDESRESDRSIDLLNGLEKICGLCRPAVGHNGAGSVGQACRMLWFDRVEPARFIGSDRRIALQRQLG
jgi:hypothetical protein